MFLSTLDFGKQVGKPPVLLRTVQRALSVACFALEGVYVTGNEVCSSYELRGFSLTKDSPSFQ
jgi:hypothetical protein